MKTLTLTLWLTLSTLAGCAVTDPNQPTPDELTEANESTEASSPKEDTSLQGLLSGQTPTTNAFCSNGRAACLTPSQCHHSEGTNIGVGTCPAGTTCCIF